MNNAGLVIIKFEVLDYYGPGDHAVERIWAKPIGDNRYTLEGIPVFAYGYSYDDVITAKETNGELKVIEAVQSGGHSTIRIMQPGGVNKASFDKSWNELRQLGCKFESNDSMSMIAIDVPPNADYKKAIAILENGKEKGFWHIEEANIK